MTLTELAFGQRVIWRRSTSERYPAEIADMEHSTGRIQIRVRLPDDGRRLWWVRLDELTPEEPADV